MLRRYLMGGGEEWTLKGPAVQNHILVKLSKTKIWEKPNNHLQGHHYFLVSLWGFFVFSQSTGYSFWIYLGSHMQLNLYKKKLIFEKSGFTQNINGMKVALGRDLP